MKEKEENSQQFSESNYNLCKMLQSEINHHKRHIPWKTSEKHDGVQFWLKKAIKLYVNNVSNQCRSLSYVAGSGNRKGSILECLLWFWGHDPFICFHITSEEILKIHEYSNCTNPQIFLKSNLHPTILWSDNTQSYIVHTQDKTHAR